MIDAAGIPAAVRNKAVAAGAAEWLGDLPALVRHLEAAWHIEVGRAFDAATEALVVEATLADGTPVVLKLVVPRDDSAAHDEITVLRLAGGEGCAELLDADEALGALLIERLGPSLYELDLPIRRRHEILTNTAARLWRRAPDARLRSGAVKARWLAEHVEQLWDELDRPCTERAVDHAVAAAERRERAHDDERAVLVHGDVHQWNVLRAGTHDDKLVDPDGLLAEPEYDLGIIMREDPVELLQGEPHDRAAWLAARTGRDITAIWEWGVIERVSTGLLCTMIRLQPVGRDMLVAADHVAAQPN
jgi:streptomycin 6-kinase